MWRPLLGAILGAFAKLLKAIIIFVLSVRISAARPSVCQSACKNLASTGGIFFKPDIWVKVTLVQALRLCTGLTAHRGSRRIALLFHDHGTRRGWGVSVTPRPLFTPGKDPVPIVQEAGWAPGPVWTGAENLAPTGIPSWTVQPVASHYTDWATRPSYPSCCP